MEMILNFVGGIFEVTVIALIWLFIVLLVCDAKCSRKKDTRF